MTSTAKLSLSVLGFSSAVLAARTWAFLQGLCSGGCFSKPKVMGLEPHHFYYGIGVMMLSLVPLAVAKSQAIRWDASIFLGAGVGLVVDELGPFLKLASYWSFTAMLIPVVTFAGLGMASLAMTVSRHGIGEFRLMQKWDAATTLSLVLFMFGFLYFEKPLGILVQVAGLGSWVASLGLMLAFGRRHFWRPELFREISVSEHS